MKTRLFDAAFVMAVLCMLAGCAGVRTDVLALPAKGDVHLEHSYTIVRSPVQEANADQARYEDLVRNELDRYGFVSMVDGRARYVLSIAYDTRPASVAVDAGDCRDLPCQNGGGPGFVWFGRAWRHSLTLRFFDPASGDEVYEVSAASRDSNADAKHAMPYLAKSALAQLPFSEYRHWSVKLHPAATPGDAPRLISVEPVHQ
jgi:hypothetical protein